MEGKKERYGTYTVATQQDISHLNGSWNQMQASQPAPAKATTLSLAKQLAKATNPATLSLHAWPSEVNPTMTPTGAAHRGKRNVKLVLAWQHQ